MSDGHATADLELSTSDTAVPSRSDKTQVPEPQMATLIEGASTRQEDVADAATIVAHDLHAQGVDPAVAQTLVADHAVQPDDGGDYRFGATVVSDGTPMDGAGFDMGATVGADDDPAARATRVADVQSSIDSAYADESEIQPGETLIGRFRIIRTLGEGSFGAVYLAHDPQLDRRVAIKVTKVGVLTTRSDVDRFQREAKAAAQLRHPNIVPVYDTGRMGRSSFLAYEYIEGTTLGSLLKDAKKLPPREAAQLMHAIAGALGYAHELGIIHRDMKPDNVLLDKQGQPHIADFGLARRDSGEMDKTREGGLMGTPLYMSPEQASGRSHEADARADVWSLGVMLREMLTGVLPFQGKLTEILIGIQTAEPPSIRTLDKSLPKDLETICQKCLSKDPALRYANGTELAAELDRYLRGEPILARPLSMPARVARWVRRNPKGAAVMAALLCAAVISTWSVIAFKQGQRQNALKDLSTLTTATSGSVQQVIDNLQANRDLVSSPLREKLAAGDLQPQARNRLLLAEATLYQQTASETVPFGEIAETLVTLSPEEIVAQVDLLMPFAQQSAPALRKISDDKSHPQRRTAQYALAKLDPGSPSWEADAADVAAGLLDATDLSSTLKLVEPIQDRLVPELQRLFDRPDSGEDAARVLAAIYQEQPEKLYSFAGPATPKQLHSLIAAMPTRNTGRSAVARLARTDLGGTVPGSTLEPAVLLAKRNAFIVLYAVARDEVDWSLLKSGADNSLRTEIIQSLPKAVADWKQAADALQTESDPSIRQALVLMLCNFSAADYELEERATQRPAIVQMFESDPSPGVHSALRRYLRENGPDELQAALSTQVGAEQRSGRDWFRNSQGQEFAVVPGPVEFLMGAPPEDVDQDEFGGERQHLRLIPRSFAIGLHEVTVDDYLRFNPEQFYNPAISPEPDCPITELSWIDAAKYCRWLSEQENVPEEEMCFPPFDQITPEMQLPPDVLQRTGYRLPTAAEWEFASRAGSSTSRWIGRAEEQARLCAWYRDNSGAHTHPVGQLEPNPLGLFDNLGNAYEYCQDLYFERYPTSSEGEAIVDGSDTRDGVDRELRGASFDFPLVDVRTSLRDALEPGSSDQRAGFRLARTIREPQLAHDNRP